MQRTPSFDEYLQTYFNYVMSGVYTSIPAVVVGIKDLSEQRIDVQPAINMRTQEGDNERQRPPILNVPLHMPMTKQGGLSYPIQNGDSVFLVFSMRGLDVWKSGDVGFTTPNSVRKFDERDCVAFAGIYPFKSSPQKGRTNAHSVNDVVLVHNIGKSSEVEIRLKPNGDVVINSPRTITVNCKKGVVNSDNVEVNADKSIFNSVVEINGQTTVNGLLRYTSGLEGSGGGGAVITGGARFVGGNITHNGVDISSTHTHIDSIGGTTTPPK